VSRSVTVDVIGADVKLSFGAPVKIGKVLVPFYTKELPVTVKIKKVPVNAEIRISADGRKIAEGECSKYVCVYNVKVPLKLRNRVRELREIEMYVAVDYGDFNVVKKHKLKVARSASFISGSGLNIIFHEIFTHFTYFYDIVFNPEDEVRILKLYVKCQPVQFIGNLTL